MKKQKPDYIAYSILEIKTHRDGSRSSRWDSVGVGFINKDGSINVRVSAVPLSGTIQLRPPKEKTN